MNEGCEGFHRNVLLSDTGRNLYWKMITKISLRNVSPLTSLQLFFLLVGELNLHFTFYILGKGVPEACGTPCPVHQVRGLRLRLLPDFYSLSAPSLRTTITSPSPSHSSAPFFTDDRLSEGLGTSGEHCLAGFMIGTLLDFCSWFSLAYSWVYSSWVFISLIPPLPENRDMLMRSIDCTVWSSQRRLNNISFVKKKTHTAFL